MNKHTIYRDTSLLHPKLVGPCKALNQYLVDTYKAGVTKTRFELFETFRSPIRQQYMLEKGSSKAGPFQSAHCVGLAVDFVPYLNQAEAAALGLTPGWSWDNVHDWKHLRDAANRFGLDVPIQWDLAHVEHPLWDRVKKTLI